MLKHFAGFANVFYNHTKSVVNRPKAKGKPLLLMFSLMCSLISWVPAIILDLSPEVIAKVREYVKYDELLYAEGRRMFEVQKQKIGKARLEAEVERFKVDLEYYQRRFNHSCIGCYS